MLMPEKVTSESIEREVQQNTTRLVSRSAWEMAEHNNSKPKVVRVRQVKTIPVMMGVV